MMTQIIHDLYFCGKSLLSDIDYSSPDIGNYFLPAQSLINGEGYSVPGQREAYHNRTPGYPVFLTPFLATFSEDSYHHAVIWVQRLMWIGLILFFLPPVSSQKSRVGFWSALIGKVLCVFALPVLLASSKVLSDASLRLTVSIRHRVVYSHPESMNY